MLAKSLGLVEIAMKPHLRIAVGCVSLVAISVLALSGCDRGIVNFPSHPDPTPPLPQNALATGNIMSYAGDGHGGYNGDIVRTKARLYWPIDCYVWQPTGEVYINDWNNHRIRLVDNATGILNTVAGGEKLVDQTVNTLNHPTNIAFFSNRTLLISSWHNHQIRYETAPRTLAILYSQGEGLIDNTRARQCKLDLPTSIDWGPDSTLYISDQGNFRIRRVPADTSNVDGTLWLDAEGQPKRQAAQDRWIFTFAGTGQAGFDGDTPKPANQVKFFNPRGTGSYPGSRLKTSPDGKWLYYCDTWNNRVRKIDLTGGVTADHMVYTVAGGASPVTTPPAINGVDDGAMFAGDGGLAVNCKLNQPTDVDFDARGNLYICDSENSRIRKVDAITGIITTVAGSGVRGYAGDDGPALSAALNRPNGIAIDRANGLLYIADVYNFRVRVMKL